jgi:hypothetical protein
LPKPKFTAEQEQAARDFMRGQIEQQIARKKDIRPFSEPQKQTEVKPGPSSNLDEMYSNHINSIITSDIVTNNEDTARANINRAVANLGFSVEIPTRPGRDIIVIKNKDKVRSPEINLKDGDAALDQIRGFMLSNAPGANDEERMTYLFNLRNQGIIGGGGVNYRNK